MKISQRILLTMNTERTNQYTENMLRKDTTQEEFYFLKTTYGIKFGITCNLPTISMDRSRVQELLSHYRNHWSSLFILSNHVISGLVFQSCTLIFILYKKSNEPQTERPSVSTAAILHGLETCLSVNQVQILHRLFFLNKFLL